jgi:hypothetical protein
MSNLMMKNDPNVIAFLGKSILKYRNYRFTFAPQKYLITGKATSVGWADDREVRVATKRPLSTWIDVFVHETCHIDQQEQRLRWYKPREDALGKVDEWLAGKNIHNVEKYVLLVAELEWDCERRSIRKIARNKLPINLKEYAQRANAYVLGYHWTLANRKWCKKSYENPNVWRSMPKTLIPLSTALYPNKKLMEAFNEY